MNVMRNDWVPNSFPENAGSNWTGRRSQRITFEELRPIAIWCDSANAVVRPLFYSSRVESVFDEAEPFSFLMGVVGSIVTSPARSDESSCPAPPYPPEGFA